MQASPWVSILLSPPPDPAWVTPYSSFQTSALHISPAFLGACTASSMLANVPSNVPGAAGETESGDTRDLGAEEYRAEALVFKGLTQEVAQIWGREIGSAQGRRTLGGSGRRSGPRP
jgi:hypothetical protein